MLCFGVPRVSRLPRPPPFPLPAPAALPAPQARNIKSLEVKDVAWFFTKEQEMSSDQLRFKVGHTDSSMLPQPSWPSSGTGCSPCLCWRPIHHAHPHLFWLTHAHITLFCHTYHHTCRFFLAIHYTYKHTYCMHYGILFALYW